MSQSNQKIEFKAQQKKKLFSRKFSSVPMEYSFIVKAIDGGEVSGMVDIEITQTLFRKKRQKLPLQVNNLIKATLWDTFMDVYVTADRDVLIEVPQRRMSAQPVIIGLILVVVAMASIIMLTTLNQ